MFENAAVEFCLHFEQIAYPPNFLRELALKFCFRQKSLKLRHSSNWAANLFKIWQNSNAAFFGCLFNFYHIPEVWSVDNYKIGQFGGVCMLNVICLSEYKYQENNLDIILQNRLNITKILQNNKKSIDMLYIVL